MRLRADVSSTLKYVYVFVLALHSKWVIYKFCRIFDPLATTPNKKPLKIMPELSHQKVTYRTRVIKGRGFYLKKIEPMHYGMLDQNSSMRI